MAFEGLSDKLQNIFKKLTGKGKLTEADIKVAMREVKLALLEADVNFLVVKKFVKAVSEKCVGSEVLESLTPGQQVIKIVRDEMVALLGEKLSDIRFASQPPTVILMAGLQGAGKTTMCGKLALHFKKKGKKPMLVACDIYRPAAINQLKVVAGQAEVPVFEMGQDNPSKIFKNAKVEANRLACDVIIVDTAGRLHIDEDMMKELKELRDTANPDETLLVIDAMTGQDAVNAAKAFNEDIELTGVILTKTDGDTRGGAALSVKDVTGKPIKFIGTGEKLADLEPFHPDRMTSRILGMGDVLTLIEKAEANFDQKKAEETMRKMRTSEFNLNDFLDQLEQMRGMDMNEMLAMMPGGSKLQGMTIDEKAMAHTRAIIQSMTHKERENPSLLNASRRKRIAAGSGTSVQEVNRLMNQFEQMKKMMKMLTGGGKKRKRGFGGFPGMPF